MELFEIVCKMLLFTTVLLNILTERVFHTWYLAALEDSKEFMKQAC